jgi:hypothetical protein
MAVSVPSMAKHRKSSIGRDGCGFLLASCIVTCCFLVINALLVHTCYYWMAPLAPPVVRTAKVAQFIMFVGPVLLVIVEWWIFDWFVDRLSRERHLRQT